MNRLLQQQRIMQKQMLEHQARMAARNREMLGAAWFDDQAQKAGLRRLRAGTSTSVVLPAQAARRGWPPARILFWVAAALVGVRLLASL